MPYSQKFEPALPLPLSFNVGDNPFDSKDRFPKRCNLFIPIESVPDLLDHIMNLADKAEKHKDGTVYDLRDDQRKKVKGFYLSGNGKIGNYDEDEFGAYGTINPRKEAPPKPPSEQTIDVEESPF